MGNLVKALDAFSGNANDMYTVLHGEVLTGDIDAFVSMCKNSGWNGEAILEAVFQKSDHSHKSRITRMKHKMAKKMGLSNHKEQFTVVSHPDLGRALAALPKLKDIWTQVQPQDPIEFFVEIKWSLKDRGSDVRVKKVLTDVDLAAKVSAAADFESILDRVADFLLNEVEDMTADSNMEALSTKLKTLLDEEAAKAADAAEKEFHRVLGVTTGHVVWVRTLRASKVVWTLAGVGLTVAAMVAGGAGAVVPVVVFYAASTVGVIKNVSDTITEIVSYCQTAASLIEQCEAEIDRITEVWKEVTILNQSAEAGTIVLEQLLPSALFETVGNVGSKIEVAGNNLDRIELKARKASSRLNDLLAESPVAEVLSELEKGAVQDEPWLSELMSEIRKMEAAQALFTKCFDTIASVNSDVLPQRSKIAKVVVAIAAINNKQPNWLTYWRLVVEYTAQVGAFTAANLLDATSPLGTVSGELGNYHAQATAGLTTLKNIKDRL